MTDSGRPLYMIGVVAEMLKLHPADPALVREEGPHPAQPHAWADPDVLGGGRGGNRPADLRSRGTWA